MSVPAGGDLVDIFWCTVMMFDERAVSFICQDEPLYGIVTEPEQSGPRAVLIVVGGPQYRAGSHRQFTLLARSLAMQGIASLRFDYRGMGDSGGAARNFEDIEADLRAGVDQLMAALPNTREVVVWGLCDGASAALFYAGQDARVTGVVLANPWARTTDGYAKTTLKHYYRQRLMDPAFWKKVFSGRFNVATAGKSFSRLVGTAMGRITDPVDAAVPFAPIGAPASQSITAVPPGGMPLPERMLAGLDQFNGKVLLIISTPDLTAQEFMDMVKGSRKWQKLLGADRVSKRELFDADHTFSRRIWRDQVAGWTADWVHSW